MDGDKIMRLHSQTAKIQGGFALFPEHAHWLDAYLLELTTFPNSKYDDQVDSTVNALAWYTGQANSSFANAIGFLRNEIEKQQGPSKTKMIRVWVPGTSSTWYLITGRQVAIPEDRIIEATEEEAISIFRAGGKRVE
jgi:hypothetical protein